MGRRPEGKIDRLQVRMEAIAEELKQITLNLQEDESGQADQSVLINWLTRYEQEYLPALLEYTESKGNARAGANVILEVSDSWLASTYVWMLRYLLSDQLPSKPAFQIGPRKG